MTLTQQIIIILMCSLGTMLTRFLPFIIFKDNKPTPEYIKYLGKALPGAVFGMLVVYCFKNVNIMVSTHGIPEAIAVVVTVGLHLWRKNMLISIAGGTILYDFGAVCFLICVFIYLLLLSLRNFLVFPFLENI